MVYIYIITMAVVTYLIRMIPMTVFQKKITNKYIKSFLYYVPYSCLMAMTFPAVFHATSSVYSALAGVIVAVVLAFYNKSLVTVAVSACVTVFVMEKIMIFMS